MCPTKSHLQALKRNSNLLGHLFFKLVLAVSGLQVDLFPHTEASARTMTEIKDGIRRGMSKSTAPVSRGKAFLDRCKCWGLDVGDEGVESPVFSS